MPLENEAFFVRLEQKHQVPNVEMVSCQKMIYATLPYGDVVYADEGDAFGDLGGDRYLFLF